MQIERLRKEGSKLVAEEQDKLRHQLQEEASKLSSDTDSALRLRVSVTSHDNLAEQFSCFQMRIRNVHCHIQRNSITIGTFIQLTFVAVHANYMLSCWRIIATLYNDNVHIGPPAADAVPYKIQ